MAVCSVDLSVLVRTLYRAGDDYRGWQRSNGDGRSDEDAAAPGATLMSDAPCCRE